MKTIRIPSIKKPEGRKINERKVAQLEKSMAEHGMMTPIHVFRLTENSQYKYGLAAGQHRLRAASNLGWTRIPVIIIEEKYAEVWKYSENAIRHNNRALGTSEDIVGRFRARNLLPGVKPIVLRGGEQPNDRGYTKLAEATSFDRKRIAEAFKHAALPKAVKDCVRENSKLDSRRTLNAVANLKSEKAQLAYLKQFLSGKAKPKLAKRTVARNSSEPLATTVTLLTHSWKTSNFRKTFDAAPKSVRRQFLRQQLRPMRRCDDQW